jgi:dipeptidyl aminopeptidase/acylaminoacyl peptidase
VKQSLRGAQKRWLTSLLGLPGVLTVLLFHAAVSSAQDSPKFVINDDCQVFDIASNNSIVYAVPHLKRIRRLVLERDDISVADPSGRTRHIVDADRFLAPTPPSGFVVNSLSWSPDGRRIAVSMTLQEAPAGFTMDKKEAKKRGNMDDAEDNAPILAKGGGKAIALLEDDGREIKVANPKTRFIEGGVDAAWLADGKTAVYLTGGPPWAISRVQPEDGKTSVLFEGHKFDAVVWDAKRNQAFAIGDLSLRGQQTLVKLDLLHEFVTEIARVKNYQGSLTVSPSGDSVGFFEDGDTVEVIDVLHPDQPLQMRVGYGRFGWGREERHILLKRGPEERSNILLWIGLHDGTFKSVLHGLVFHDFEIAPDGETLAVTDPGRRILKVYPLE